METIIALLPSSKDNNMVLSYRQISMPVAEDPLERIVPGPRHLESVEMLKYDIARHKLESSRYAAAKAAKEYDESLWVPVSIRLTHDCKKLITSLIGECRRHILPATATQVESQRRDIDCGRYSSSCTWHKIEHQAEIECHGWRRENRLRWIVDTDGGLIVGECRLRHGVKLPDSQTLLNRNDTIIAPKFLAALQILTSDSHQDRWEKLMARQKESVAMAKAVQSRRPLCSQRIMSIENSHARSAAIEACGGWHRICNHLPKIEEKDDGILHRADFAGINLLIVRCPSTKKHYAIKVPPRINTVRGALKFANGIDSNLIVAHA